MPARLSSSTDPGPPSALNDNQSRKAPETREYLQFYIDGKWVDPTEAKTLDVINPATEEVAGKISLGNATDVDKAVKAARKAFATWSQTSREERLDVLNRILAEYQKRFSDQVTLTGGLLNSSSKVNSELYGNHTARQQAGYLQADPYQTCFLV